MERAFDEVVIRKEDWDLIIQSIEAQLQRGNSNPQSGGEGGQGGGNPEQGDMAQQIEQLIDNLPDPAKQFLGQMIAQGTPIREAVGQVVEELQNAQTAQEGN